MRIEQKFTSIAVVLQCPVTPLRPVTRSDTVTVYIVHPLGVALNKPFEVRVDTQYNWQWKQGTKCRMGEWGGQKVPRGEEQDNREQEAELH